LEPGELLSGTDDIRFRIPWAMANAETFGPSIVAHDQRAPAAKDPIIVASGLAAESIAKTAARLQAAEEAGGDAR
jgi:hypothetical protein